MAGWVGGDHPEETAVQEDGQNKPVRDVSEDDEPGTQPRKSKPPAPKSLPTRQRQTGDADSSENGVDGLSESLGGLSLSLKLEGNAPSKKGHTVGLVVYDTETTGLGATNKVQIMELGEYRHAHRAQVHPLTRAFTGAVAVVYTDNVWSPIEEFHAYVQPKAGSKVQASVPHSLTPEKLALRDAKPFSTHCSGAFVSFIKRQLDRCNLCVVVAHNGKRFDHRLLFFHGLSPPKCPALRFADSIEWFRRVSKSSLKSYSIRNLYMDSYGKVPESAHNALPDCYALINLLNSSAFNVSPDLAWELSEPWGHIRSRCVK